MAGPRYIANLASSWIPALDGVEARLAAGGRGGGWYPGGGWFWGG